MNTANGTKPRIDEMEIGNVLKSIERIANDGFTSEKNKIDFKYGALKAAYESLWLYCKNKIKDLPQ